jgi:O-antigen biosynthesis protein
MCPSEMTERREDGKERVSEGPRLLLSHDQEALRYDARVDLSNENNSHTQLVLMAGRNNKVLEFGPATGYVTRVLKERGCRVTGVEIDSEAAEEAAPFCERIIVGDAETLDFEATFADERFDVVMFGDVLEHLVDPSTVLRNSAALLRPGGSVVASVPNVGHASVRLALLSGRFPYTELGLLDRTHLRFFTRESLEQLFRDAGLSITQWKPIVQDPFDTELGLREEEFPRKLVDALRREPAAMTYQFMVRASPGAQDRAVPSPEDGVLRELQEEEIRAERMVAELRETIGEREAVLEDMDAVISEAEVALAEKDATITAKDAGLAERDEKIAEKDGALADRDRRLGEAETRYEAVVGSIGYRFAKKIRRAGEGVAPAHSRRRNAVVMTGHAVDVLLTRGFFRAIGGFFMVWRWVPRLFQKPAGPMGEPAPLETGPIGEPAALEARLAGVELEQNVEAERPAAQATPSLDEQYRHWLYVHRLTPDRREALVRASASFSYRPKISIVMPTYNTDPRWLREAIESVRGQIYDNWELCIADDGSTLPATRVALRRLDRRNSRIRVNFLPGNLGIGGASNEALALATGEFVGFLDHDDLLKPEALLEVVRLLNREGDLDFIYSDEDKLDAKGQLVEPFFKPDWSPDLLTSVNYVTHFSVYRAAILDQVGGLRAGYDGSQDYDLALRVTEVTDRIAHIPKPLYTWRKVPGSAAASVDAKPFAREAARRALADSLVRRRYPGEVVDGLAHGRYRVKYDIVGDPRVAIVIPTRDRVDLLRPCVESIQAKSTYRNYEIVVIDNNSAEKETLAYLSNFGGRVLEFRQEFNFSRMMNFAVREVDCDAVILLNNDTEVISSEWIEALLEHGQRPGVAAAGARLLFPDGRPQHEGIIIGFAGGAAGNVDHGGFYGLGDTVRNCSAVTAACMLTRPEVYWDLAGFDERLRVAFNDVDFCLRAREKGYSIVYTPYALLYHIESATRKRLHPREDERFFRERWGQPGEYRDPYYNPNFRPREPFVLRFDPPED